MCLTNASDAIIVRGIEFEANHGYTAAERRATRRFRVHVAIEANIAKAGHTDRLADTVDYQRVCALIVEEGTRSTHKLLETLGAQMIRALNDVYKAARIIVEIEKLSPPCRGVPASCAVRMSSDSFD